MPELKLYAPTYNRGESRADTEKDGLPDFGDPRVPVVIREADGVRIVLGSHDYWDMKSSDVQIERRPGGWAIFLHPVGGSDPSGYVYFLDDGRSFLVPEGGLGPTPAIVVRDWDEAVPEVDDPKNAATERKLKACELCGARPEVSGDDWSGMCPDCDDFVTAYLDFKGLPWTYRDAAVEFLKTDPKQPVSSNSAFCSPSHRETRRPR